MRKAKDGTDTTVRKTESWKMNTEKQLRTGTYKNTDVMSAKSVTTNFNGSAELHRLATLFFHPSCHSQIKQDLCVTASSLTSKNRHYQHMSVNTNSFMIPTQTFNKCVRRHSIGRSHFIAGLHSRKSQIKITQIKNKNPI
jgi:hypothetical protein